MWPFPMESAHPLIVHFPIALLLSAALLDMLATAVRKPSWHRVALWNLGVGTLGASAAVWSGLRAAEVAKHSFEIHQVMERHQTLGIATLVLAAVLAAARLIVRDRLPAWWRAFALLAVLALAGTLGYTAHLGGRLVYEFGVGGSFGASDSLAQPSSHHH
ncbi:MAG TPA: DUF2231 domain-containing protein [bacterium]